MNAKQKLTAVKDNLVQLYTERPVEMLIATGIVVTSVAKLIGSTADARNAQSWSREVRRREQISRRVY